MFKRVLFPVVIGALVLAGCAGQSAAATSAPESASASVAPEDRTIYMAVVEFKSSTTVDNNPFPTEALPEGDGYVLEGPEADGTWVVETYRLDPGSVVVNQGDKVTLEIIAINGKEHPISVEGYNASGVVKRGQVTRITFTADKAGIFEIVGSSKPPTLRAQLVVMPNK